jgi:hypothetical protein
VIAAELVRSTPPHAWYWRSAKARSPTRA